MRNRFSAILPPLQLMTAAIVGADAEYAQIATDGARACHKRSNQRSETRKFRFQLIAEF